MNRNKIVLEDFFDLQVNERYKACIIEGNLYNLNKDICNKIANALNAPLIDLIKVFINNEEISKKIDLFDVEELKLLLKDYGNKHEIILVYGLDMAWNIWSSYEKKRFIKMVEMDTVSPFRNVLYIFFMRKDHTLKTTTLKNTLNYSRIIDINEVVIGGARNG
jgi:hypothetical protein